MRFLPFLLVALGACANFDRPEIVKDLRVLAVQSEPAEVMVSPLMLFAPPELRDQLPSIEVATTAFAFDPRGTLVHAATSFCVPADEGGSGGLFEGGGGGGGGGGPGGGGGGPGGGSGSGGDAALSEACPFGPLQDDVTSDRDDPIGRVPGLAESFTLDADAIIGLVGGEDAVGTLASPFPVYPRLSLSVRTTVGGVVEIEDAFKRVPFTLDLRGGVLPPDLIAAVTAIAGGPPCPAEGPPANEPVEGPATCVVARGANLNPLLLGFEQLEALESFKERVLPDDLQPGLSADARIEADPGEALYLEPVFRTGSVEPFQAFLVDLQTGTQSVENRLEFFDKRWFATAGDIGDTGGGGPGGGGPGGGGPGDGPPDSEDAPGGPLDEPTGTTWTLPTARDSGDEDALVLVVADGRGGTAVGRITVRYR